MKVLKKVLAILPVIIFLAGFSIIIYASYALRKAEIPNIFGYSFMVVKTDSMEPNYMVGDLLVVKINTEYNEDDVISFYYDLDEDGKEELVSHRIDSISDGIYTMVGDNPNTEGKTQTITKDKIIGKVVRKSAFLGTLVSSPFLENKQMIFALISIILVVFIVYQFINIIKMTKKQDKK